MTSQDNTLDPQEMLQDVEWIGRIARVLTGNATDADDLEQATYLALLEQGPRRIVTPRAWLYGLMRNLAGKRRMREGRQATLRMKAADEPAVTETLQPSEAVELAQTRRSILEAVLGLPEPYREVVLLRYYEGRNATQVGELLGVKPATVRTQLGRGMEMLRRQLEAEHGGSWRAMCLSVVPAIPTATPPASTSVEPQAQVSWPAFAGVLIPCLALISWWLLDPVDLLPTHGDEVGVTADLDDGDWAPQSDDNGVLSRIEDKSWFAATAIVLDAARREPVEGVVFRDYRSGQSYSSVRGERPGEYEVQWPVSAVFEYWIEAEGFRRHKVRSSGPRDDECQEFLEGKPRYFYLQRECETVVRILPEHWEQVSSNPPRMVALAYRIDQKNPATEWPIHAEVDEDGVFRFDNLNLYERYNIIFWGEGYTCSSLLLPRNTLMGGWEKTVRLQRLAALPLAFEETDGDPARWNPELETGQAAVEWQTSHGVLLQQGDPRLSLQGISYPKWPSFPDWELRSTALIAVTLGEPTPHVTGNVSLPGYQFTKGTWQSSWLSERPTPTVMQLHSVGQGHGEVDVIITGAPRQGYTRRQLRGEALGCAVLFVPDLPGHLPTVTYRWQIPSAQDRSYRVSGLPSGRYRVFLETPLSGAAELRQLGDWLSIEDSGEPQTVQSDLSWSGSVLLMPGFDRDRERSPEHNYGAVMPYLREGYRGAQWADLRRVETGEVLALRGESATRILGLAPGEYEIRASVGFWNASEAYLPDWVRFTVTAGDEEWVRFTMPEYMEGG